MLEDLRISVPDTLFCRDFLSSEEAADFMRSLTESISWRAESIRMFGKEIAMPRLTAWYGDPGAVYTYSRRSFEPGPWSETLLELKARVEKQSDCTFNSVLLNLYRDGHDSMGWHSDDEPELGSEPVIAAVSLGASRELLFRHRRDKGRRWKVELTDGSLLIMRGSTQSDWQHSIAKSTKAIGPRINLTFRAIQLDR